MKRELWIALTLVGVVVCVAFSMQRIEAQSTGPFTMYSKGPVTLSVSTRSGQVLTSLEIPAGVALSISAPNVFAASGGVWDGKQMPERFTGDVSIMTRLSSELANGPLRDQMLASPLRLDVQDAVVVVTRQP
jgi:hypothetical protein